MSLHVHEIHLSDDDESRPSLEPQDTASSQSGTSESPATDMTSQAPEQPNQVPVQHTSTPPPVDWIKKIDAELNEVVQKHLEHRIKKLSEKVLRKDNKRARLEQKLEWIEVEIMSLELLVRMGNSTQNGTVVVEHDLVMARRVRQIRELGRLVPVLRAELEKTEDALEKMRGELDELKNRERNRFWDDSVEPLPEGVGYFTVII
ncbi:hypothetical protein GE09DRAFT_1273149 [Coniochaeta sp. 2T2.1]|nr:hypothetical protein GE09DRAFT_1273149 [Coniochaeta sp. 2T2.1]